MKISTKLFFALFFFISFSFVLNAQEITENDKKQQEERLKEDPKDYAANFVVGAYYYNMALAPQEETSKMKVVGYMSEGKPYDKTKASHLQKALPYFENAYAIQKNENVKEILKQIYQQTGQLSMSKVGAAEIESKLQERLDKIEFKTIE
ncbi:MAG: hypothetical protein EAZ44_08595 [Cytophagia bacterium]|nr:MAG: hypothetical protein EAY69_01180 [Cytophagales bacterium]TAG01258.1 MAG: hypothetical protein EAZ44_08595 [Cytophagia bacterium]TAG38925.1 MAG: hypothetical protein EAZ31_09930 [Cytophagia bacterium]TAH28158.1 MAG: hypothetical protein EAZ06_11150 [Cytophagales bacterium]